MALDREAKMKALDAALTQIERAYGKGAVMKLGDPANTMGVETCLLYTSPSPRDRG